MVSFIDVPVDNETRHIPAVIQKRYRYSPCSVEVKVRVEAKLTQDSYQYEILNRLYKGL